MTTRTALILVAGFVAGCGAAALAPLVIPPANAQTTTRWETFCVAVDGRNSGAIANAVTSVGNRAGSQGWELVSAPGSTASLNGVACFKRPAP